MNWRLIKANSKAIAQTLLRPGEHLFSLGNANGGIRYFAFGYTRRELLRERREKLQRIREIDELLAHSAKR